MNLLGCLVNTTLCIHHKNKVELHTTLICVLYDTGSANHPNKNVISTPTVPYNTPLVWYVHFIFHSVVIVPHSKMQFSHPSDGI